MRTSGIVGFGLLAFVFVGTLHFIRLATLIDIPLFFLVFGGAASLAVLSYGVTDFVHAAWAARAVLFSTSPGEACRRDLTVLKGTIGHAYGCGALAVVIGVILVLSHAKDLAQIGEGLGVACLGLLYAIVLAEVLIRPAIRNTERVLAERSTHEMPILRHAEEAWTRLV